MFFFFSSPKPEINQLFKCQCSNVLSFDLNLGGRAIQILNKALPNWVLFDVLVAEGGIHGCLERDHSHSSTSALVRRFVPGGYLKCHRNELTMVPDVDH